MAIRYNDWVASLSQGGSIKGSDLQAFVRDGTSVAEAISEVAKQSTFIALMGGAAAAPAFIDNVIATVTGYDEAGNTEAAQAAGLLVNGTTGIITLPGGDPGLWRITASCLVTGSFPRDEEFELWLRGSTGGDTLIGGSPTTQKSSVAQAGSSFTRSLPAGEVLSIGLSMSAGTGAISVDLANLELEAVG